MKSKIVFKSLSTITIALLASTTSYAAYNGVCQSQQDITDLPPGHWCSVPNSQARSVEKRPQEYSDWNGSSSAAYNSIQGYTGFRAIMLAWSGGAFDSLRDRLIIFGGGHHDYAGNEIIAFSLQTLSWSRITDPTPFPSDRVNGDYKNADGTPISRHTVSGYEYLEHADRLYAFGGGGWSNGYPVAGTWTFDLAAAEKNGNSATNGRFWQDMQPTNQPSPQEIDIGMYDPVSKLMFQSQQLRDGFLLAYDFDKNTWTRMSTTGGRNMNAYSALDPVSRQFIIFNATSTADVRRWTIPAVAGTTAYVDSNTGGDTTMDRAANAGTAYDYAAKKIVAYNGGTSVYAYDSATNSWEARPAAATNVANPGAVTAYGGVYGRFRYSKRLNVYVYVDSVNSNVYLYRLGAAPVRPTAPQLIVK